MEQAHRLHSSANRMTVATGVSAQEASPNRAGLGWVEAGQNTITALEGQLANHEDQLANHEDQLANHEDQLADQGEELTIYEDQLVDQGEKLMVYEDQLMNYESQLDQVWDSVFDPNGNELFFSQAEIFSQCIPKSSSIFDSSTYSVPSYAKASFCSINYFEITSSPSSQRCYVYKSGSEWKAYSIHDSGGNCECEIFCIWLF